MDGLRASKVVRGPLAEGEAVDMGAPAGVSSTPSANDHADFSPDVQHNRQWLRALMARHQFAHLPDAWWHFAYQPAQQSAVAEVDVAERWARCRGSVKRACACGPFFAEGRCGEVFHLLKF